MNGEVVMASICGYLCCHLIDYSLKYENLPTNTLNCNELVRGVGECEWAAMAQIFGCMVYEK